MKRLVVGVVVSGTLLAGCAGWFAAPPVGSTAASSIPPTGSIPAAGSSQAANSASSGASPPAISGAASPTLPPSTPPAGTNPPTSPSPSRSSTLEGARPAGWSLVALGDSIPFGERYCDFCTSFVELYAKSISRVTGHPVRAVNRGVPGLTSAELLTDLRTRKDLRAAVAAADVVTVTIGHNDTPWNSLHDTCDGDHGFFGGYRNARWDLYDGPCLQTETQAYRAELGAILMEIRALRGDEPTLIRVTTDYNQVIGQPTAPLAARAPSKGVLDALARVACDVAIEHLALCTDVYHAFNGFGGTRDAGSLLAGDHDHPSQAGHRLIASLLAKLGYAPLFP